MGAAQPMVLWFQDCRTDAVPLVGGKCASLGELIHAGVRVPPGFALTTHAYRRVQFRPPEPLLNGLDARVNGILGALSIQTTGQLPQPPLRKSPAFWSIA